MATRSFSLQPITAADAPTIGRIGNESFKTDRHTMMKTQGGYNHNDTAQEPLAWYLSVPEKTQGIKAVDKYSDRTIGYVFWGFRGYTRETVPTLTGRGVGEDVEKVPQAQPGSSATSQVPIEDNNNEDSDDPIKRLTSITDADMEHWMKTLMPEGTKCMFIRSLSVDPVYASQGIGSALMEWGTTQADQDSVFCWVHSSESAYSFYSKHDFQVIGSLEVDLDEYCLAAAPDCDGKWGRYTFRYMKRLPRSC
jgi:GNAT superfamily N-acetyltransferase